ncbi:MAG: hypothetical protein WA738_21310, partial [Candidatus Angelobacter sp.]
MAIAPLPFPIRPAAMERTSKFPLLYTCHKTKTVFVADPQPIVAGLGLAGQRYLLTRAITGSRRSPDLFFSLIH